MRADSREGAEDDGMPTTRAVVPSYWACFAWWPLVRPRPAVWLVVLGAVLATAGGLAGVVRGARSACEARQAAALSRYGHVADKLQQELAVHTLPVVSVGAFVRQTPLFWDLAQSFDSIASDLLGGQDVAVKNLQLAPGGVVSAIHPLAGHEGAVGHDLFLDPLRHPDSVRTVAGAPGVTISNPVTLTLEGQSGTAVFARYPVFVDGPVENRTEAFGKPDASNCTDLCYGDPLSVFWGLVTALVDFDKLLELSGLTELEGQGACFELRTGFEVQLADSLSSDSTVYRSNCTAPNPAVITVVVPNGQWYLEIGDSDACAPWAVPLAVLFPFAVLLLLALGLLSVHQGLTNTRLSALRHEAELSHLKEREEHAAREEALVGSDAVHALVGSFFQKMDSCGKPRKGLHAVPAKSAGSSNSMSTASNILNPTSLPGNCFLVVARLCCQGTLKLFSAKAKSDIMEGVGQMILDMAGENSSMIEITTSANGVYVLRVKSVALAVSFSLRLRTALLESTWPEEVLRVPGYEPKQLAVFFQKAAGPSLHTVIDWERSEETHNQRLQLSAAILPRQIVITADAWSQLAHPSTLAAAGYPDISPMGSFSLKDKGVIGVYPLFEVNDAKWDFHKPQVEHITLPSQLVQLALPSHNMYMLPAARTLATDQNVTAVMLKMEGPKSHPNASNASLPPSADLAKKLRDSVHAMALLYSGNLITDPSAWSAFGSTIVIFRSVDLALAFSCSLQLILLHAQWSPKDLIAWGHRELGRLRKLIFSGPRVKCAVALCHLDDPKAQLFEESITSSSFFNLLGAAHGGQILVSGEAMAKAKWAAQVDKIRMYDMGQHHLTCAIGDEPMDVKEVQLVDVPRSFPAISTFKMLSPGYHSSPDPNGKVAFVYCQVWCPGGGNISSSPIFNSALQQWKQLVEQLSTTFLGYMLLDRGLGVAVALPSLENALTFAVSLQSQAMNLPVDAELLATEGFEEVKDPNGKVLYRGLRVKIGISYGHPTMRRPSRDSGRASYVGDKVQLGARLMIAACPGQIIMDGSAAISDLGVPEEVFKAKLLDAEQEPVTVFNEELKQLGFPDITVAALGYFSLEGMESAVPLANVLNSFISGRHFSSPPGRVGENTLDEVDMDSTPQHKLKPKRKSHLSLNHLVSDILENRSDKGMQQRAEEKVQILGKLGEGKQGKVLRGKWKGVDVAYKVITLPPTRSKQDKAETRALLEMAISATMAHPNVVQTYSYELAVMETKSTGTARGLSSSPLASLLSNNTKDTDASHIMEEAASLAEAEAELEAPSYQEARLIQELCDMKTLRHNLDSRKLVVKGQMLPDVGAALTLAYDVACGLQHIHSQNIIHGDLKALNVLCCSSIRKQTLGHPSLPRLIAKVSDFGLSARLSAEETHVSNVHSGTASHMAPEIIVAGHLSKAADVYAFGILLYEMFTGRRAYEGMSMQQVLHAVSTRSQRLVFSPGVPFQIIELACTCWGPAAGRPTFEDIVLKLVQLVKAHKRGELRAPPAEGAAMTAEISATEEINSVRAGESLPAIDFKALQSVGASGVSTAKASLPAPKSRASADGPFSRHQQQQQQQQLHQRLANQVTVSGGTVLDVGAEIDYKALQSQGSKSSGRK